MDRLKRLDDIITEALHESPRYHLPGDFARRVAAKRRGTRWSFENVVGAAAFVGVSLTVFVMGWQLRSSLSEMLAELRTTSAPVELLGITAAAYAVIAVVSARVRATGSRYRWPTASSFRR